MYSELKEVFQRSRSTLAQDAIGVAALMVMLLVALHLPGVL